MAREKEYDYKGKTGAMIARAQIEGSQQQVFGLPPAGPKQPTSAGLWSGAIVLALGCYALAYLCKHHLSISDGIAAIWLADALTIAYLFRYSYSSWPLLLLASFAGTLAAAVVSGIDTAIAPLYSLAGAIEACCAAGLLRLFCARGDFFDGTGRWLKFIMFGALLPTFVGAGFGAFVAFRFAELPFVDVFLVWYLADVIGISVFFPIVYLWLTGSGVCDFSLRACSRFLTVSSLALTGISLLLFAFPHPFVFISLPLIWAVSRLEIFQSLLLIFVAIVVQLLAFSGRLPWLPVGAGEVQDSLDLLPLYAAVFPAYIMAVVSRVERQRGQRIIEVESSFRAAMASSRIGMLLVSLDNRIIQSNPSFCRFIGFTDIELRGMSIHEVVSIPPYGIGIRREETEGFERPLLDLEFGFVQDAELCFIRKDGKQLWGHWSCSVARGSNNEPQYVVVQVEDIDWRKHSEEQLARAEERWKFSLSVTGQVVYDWDLITGKTFFSEWLGSGIGIEPSSLKSRNDWLQRLVDEDRQRLEEAQEAHIDGDAADIDCQYRVRTDSGELRWIHEVAHIMESSHGDESLRLIGVLRDITQNKQMAQSLEEEKERLQVTLDAIADAVIATDQYRNVTFMNPVAEQLSGWKLNEVLGKQIETILNLSYGRGSEKVPRPVEECLTQNRSVFSAEGAVLYHRDGSGYDVKCSASPLRSCNGELLGAVLVFQDVTETRQLIRQLRYKASHDHLTSLPNREAFRRDLLEAVSTVRNSERVHVLAYMDLDRFKVINDSAGHQAGDALLKNVARFLRGHLRASDQVARLGGDEFGILLRDCSKKQGIARCEQLVRKIIALRFPWGGRIFDVGASVGVTEVSHENSQVADLMSQADVACYSAKHSGRGAVMLYEPDRSAAAEQHREIHMASRIRTALDQGSFRLYAQPIANSANPSEIHHYEILVRMLDSNGDIIFPGAFIPAAERYGLMLQIDSWVAQEFFGRKAESITESGLKFALNLSADALSDSAFQQAFFDMLRGSSVVPSQLGVEITETAMINQMESASQFVAELRSMGCTIALDDFGNGLSSFNYLKNFAIDYIKIDGSFVRHVDSNFVDLMIVESINQVAHRLKAKTIAEFVEDQATVDKLDKIGVDLVQGYHIGRPVPLDEVLDGVLNCRAPRERDLAPAL
ncbi:EAL domain-containing protein [Microbulbifer agarilyticus]|uniref:EAL domain-containing protein n=1 Tax=Microbulbifer agarilyticus TaxID=260552 RepID=UPI001CD200EC|nr:EAL domain-containing protein [Microbulbifer agarilyticus]MCA0894268.1 EAL domain-containing protein [Microbulbifer agarilyticus]